MQIIIDVDGVIAFKLSNISEDDERWIIVEDKRILTGRSYEDCIQLRPVDGGVLMQKFDEPTPDVVPLVSPIEFARKHQRGASAPIGEFVMRSLLDEHRVWPGARCWRAGDCFASVDGATVEYGQVIQRRRSRSKSEPASYLVRVWPADHVWPTDAIFDVNRFHFRISASQLMLASRSGYDKTRIRLLELLVEHAKL